MLCNIMIYDILNFFLYIWLYFTQNRSTSFTLEYVEIDDVDGNLENNEKKLCKPFFHCFR